MDANYYKSLIEDLQQKLPKYIKQDKTYSLLRLLVFIGGLFLTYQLLRFNVNVGLTAFLFSIISFVFVYIKQLRNEKKLIWTKDLISIYQNEISIDATGQNIFGNGQEYMDPDHPYCNDLDVFGKHSIFNLINRTVSLEGKKLLADYLLKGNTNSKVIYQRQEAIQELSLKVNFKESFLSKYFRFGKRNVESNSIFSWFSNFKTYFIHKKSLSVVLNIISIILLALVVASFIFEYAYIFLTFMVLVSYIINEIFRKRVNVIHANISRQGDLFSKYSELVGIIHKSDFESALLKSIKGQFGQADQIVFQLKLISKLVEKLDYRMNLMVAFFLNVFFFWDIHQSRKIEKWIAANKDRITAWLHPIAQVDALLSLSIFHFNHPSFVFPIINENKDIYIDTKAVGHPLIPENINIKNDYFIDGNGKFDIITGSNMAGKTTFLRTIALNSVLAYCGSPVCAQKFEISQIKLITYMRITDSLEYELSTFHAEINRIKQIILFVNNNKNCFLLLDELLRGTNTRDRQIGTKSLIKQLVQSAASGMVSTHDLALISLQDKLENAIRSFHFTIVNIGEELDFDYKIKTGVCSNNNASILMKKIGINIDESL